MKRFDNRLKDSAYLAYRLIAPVVDPLRAVRGLAGYVWFLRDFFRYRAMPGAERQRFIDVFPSLHDKGSNPFDPHYFYQDIWAFKKINELKPAAHVDVASRVDLVGFLSTTTDVTYVDIRPLDAKLPTLRWAEGTITALPYENNSVSSISCLHVAEHIGLGRYGDPLDPEGTRKAARELARVLAPGGMLLFSLPVGKPRLCFNSHRIHSPREIAGYFEGLTLIEFSGVDDAACFHRHADMDAFASQNYAAGLFHFTKPGAQ